MANLYLIGTVPLWLIALAIGAIVALLVLQYRGLRQRLSLGRAAVLLLLRGIVYAGLVFFLFVPALIDRKITKLRRPLTVLIDSSQSMAFPADPKAAPGGDNPTPDQDVVEEIGRALGVQYDDNEELKSADKIAERDRHRWEFDPASSEDYKDRR